MLEKSIPFRGRPRAPPADSAARLTHVLADLTPTGHRRAMMIDPLLAQAQQAIDEAAALRAQRQLLRKVAVDEIDRMRLMTFESASVRAEIKAYRDDRGVR